MRRLGLVVALCSAGCTPSAVPPTVHPPLAVVSWPTWPNPGARIARIAPLVPQKGRKPRILVDPGHGARDNFGNTSVACRREADEMLRVGTVLLDHLRANGAFALATTRTGDQLVDYGTRIRQGDAWLADALVSLHSDARRGTAWGPDPETGCLRSDEAFGFTLLWSDEGPEPLVRRRQALARALAARLIQAGFPPYAAGYDTYAVDPEHPGVFVDRHVPSDRIRMLRRPKVPSVIIETHQALDPLEVARWQEPAVLEAFSSAIARALVDFTASDAR